MECVAVCVYVYLYAKAEWKEIRLELGWNPPFKCFADKRTIKISPHYIL